MSNHSAEMIKQLQPFQQKSATYKAIFDAESIQFENRDAALADLNLQLSVDTATWALVIYEQELGIPTYVSKPLSVRRSVIKSKMRGTGKVDAALIKIVSDSYTNGNVEVTFDGTIRITFVDENGDPPDLEELKATIEEIKPAHLVVVYEFINRIYGSSYVGMLVTEADAVTLTIKTKTWSSLSGTWNGIPDGTTFMDL